jgi:hypothetical protein
MMRFPTRLPELSANLAAPCVALPPRPDPFLDPERLVWEVDVVSSYGACATLHAKTVEAWAKAAASKPQ